MPILIPALDELQIVETLDIDGRAVGLECEPFGRWLLMKPDDGLWEIYPPNPLSPRYRDDTLTTAECLQIASELTAAAALAQALNQRHQRSREVTA